MMAKYIVDKIHFSEGIHYSLLFQVWQVRECTHRDILILKVWGHFCKKLMFLFSTDALN